RFRAYLGYPNEGMGRLQGEQAVPRFIDYSRRTTVFPNFYNGPVRSIGPLASFSCDEDWVEHPYSNGVALIGDAAATTDPVHGQGMSLTLRDVRTLSQRLLSISDWNTAGHDFATEHQRYFSVIHSSCELLRQIFQEQGPEADRRRTIAMPLIQEDPSRLPDHIISAHLQSLGGIGAQSFRPIPARGSFGTVREIQRTRLLCRFSVPLLLRPLINPFRYSVVAKSLVPYRQCSAGRG